MVKVKGFIVSIFLVFIMAINIGGCTNKTTTTVQERPLSAPPVLGEKVAVPMGYVFHCIDYPDSVFCVQEQEE